MDNHGLWFPMIRVFTFATDQRFAGEISAELEEHGCDVSVFADVRRGLVEAVKRHPDLILLAADLPGTSGYTVCNKVKRSPLKEVPLILITEDGDPEAITHRQLPTRADDYVTKGLSPTELTAHIRQLIPLTPDTLASGGPAAISDVDAVLGLRPGLSDRFSASQDSAGDQLTAEVDAAMGALFDSVLSPPSDPPTLPLGAGTTAAEAAGLFQALRPAGSGSPLPSGSPGHRPFRTHTKPAIAPPLGPLTPRALAHPQSQTKPAIAPLPDRIPAPALGHSEATALELLEQQLSQAEREIDSLRQQLDEQEALAAEEISSLRQQLEEQAEQQDQAVAAIGSLRLQLEEQAEREEELQDLADQEIRSLKQQLEIIQAEAAKAVTALRADLARYQDRAAAALEAQKEAEQKLEQARTAAAEAGSLRPQLDALRQALAAKDQELLAAQQASAAGSAQPEQIAQLEQQATELTAQLEALTAERNEALTRAADFRAKAKRIAEQLNIRSRELHEAEQRHREQLAQLSGAGAGPGLGEAAPDRAQQAAQIEQLTQQHAAELEALARDREQAQQQLDEELEEQNAKHEAVLAEMAAEHAAELSTQQAQWTAREKALLQQVAELEELAGSRRSDIAELSQWQQQAKEAHAALKRTKKALAAVVAHLEAAIDEGPED